VDAAGGVTVLDDVAGAEAEDGREDSGIVRHDVDVVHAGATPAPGTPPRNRRAPEAVAVPADGLAETESRDHDGIGAGDWCRRGLRSSGRDRRDGVCDWRRRHRHRSGSGRGGQHLQGGQRRLLLSGSLHEQPMVASLDCGGVGTVGR